MTKHTPTPWYLKDGCLRAKTTPYNIYVSDTIGLSVQDAEHIVKCVNSHDTLIEENKKLREVLGECVLMLRTAQYMVRNVANGYHCEVETDIRDLEKLEGDVKQALKETEQMENRIYIILYITIFIITFGYSHNDIECRDESMCVEQKSSGALLCSMFWPLYWSVEVFNDGVEL